MLYRIVAEFKEGGKFKGLVLLHWLLKFEVERYVSVSYFLLIGQMRACGVVQDSVNNYGSIVFETLVNYLLQLYTIQLQYTIQFTNWNAIIAQKIKLVKLQLPSTFELIIIEQQFYIKI